MCHGPPAPHHTSRNSSGNKPSICAPHCRAKTPQSPVILRNATHGEDCHAHRGMYWRVRTPRERRVDSTSPRVVPNEAFHD